VTNFGPGRDKILLRGLSDGVFTGRTQSTVSLYLDDVPLTYNAPDPDLRLIDVDAVEVLRGPQGVLYGAGSIGGVVHIITHKPDLDTYSGSLSLTGILTKSGVPSTILKGMANMPLLPGRLGLRVVAYRETDGGYINDPVLHRTDVNQTSRTGARALVLLQLSRDWKATLGGVYQSINSAETTSFRSLTTMTSMRFRWWSKAAARDGGSNHRPPGRGIKYQANTTLQTP
jgi:outer membrane receptor protein involved in Fe transport